MSNPNNTTVALESFIEAEQPVKFPQLRRKNIVRLRGRTEVSDRTPALDGIFRELDGISKPLFFHTPLAVPPVDVLIEVIATEGIVQYFVKWWKIIEVTKYKLHASDELKVLALDVLASMPDERVCADDLHSKEIMKWLADHPNPKTPDKPKDPRTLGAILAALGKEGVIKPVTHTFTKADGSTITVTERKRSGRDTCHNRPNLVVWTWAWKQRALGT